MQYPFPGNVRELENIIERSIALETSNIILPENLEKRFKVGMNGDVDIILDQKENVLSIPIDCLITRDGENFVDIKNAEVKEAKAKAK